MFIQNAEIALLRIRSNKMKTQNKHQEYEELLKSSKMQSRMKCSGFFFCFPSDLSIGKTHCKVVVFFLPLPPLLSVLQGPEMKQMLAFGSKEDKELLPVALGAAGIVT